MKDTPRQRVGNQALTFKSIRARPVVLNARRPVVALHRSITDCLLF